MINVKEIIHKLTLEEKAGLCSGKDFYATKEVPHLGIQSIVFADGPVGLRKQTGSFDHLGLNVSVKATGFPSGCLTACSFNRDLMEELGNKLGEQCQAEQVSVLLGPAVNIKRSPLCGRNFEYFSEDPYLSGELAVPFIKGLQSKNIGASIKHFAVNSQEKNRTTSSSNLDERTLREIYLPTFEKAVKEAKPWSVMASYNKINGVYASENKYLLTDILRKEWGFDGFVVSDWNAVVHRAEGLEAGMDLEMPGTDGRTDAKIVEAVKSGKMSEETLNQAVERILQAVFQYHGKKADDVTVDFEKAHRAAADMAAQSMVLLKNDGVLPLDKTANVAFIGEFAKYPRYQGGGSANVNAYKVESALDCAEGLNVSYARGYDTLEDEKQEELFDEAVAVASLADVAVIFIGLPDSYESEGYDRNHLNIPEIQNKLVEAICQKQKKVIVVLHNGAPVLMPWLDKVNAVLESYLAGEAVGRAQVDILFGDVNPGGKLAETFPIHLGHNPSYTNFAEESKEVDYKEGIFVGYRWYDKRNMEVLFPFGHGLSYTRFAYDNLQVSSERITDQDTLEVTVDITNTGSVAGREIVQLYVSDRTGIVIRPEKELKGFESILLEPAETKTVTMTLDKRSFAWYNEQISDWYCASGEYAIKIGKSSREIVLEKSITVSTEVVLPRIITEDTILGEIMDNPQAYALIMELMKPFFDAFGMKQDKMGEEILKGLPLRGMQGFAGLGDVELEQTIETLNLIFSDCK